MATPGMTIQGDKDLIIMLDTLGVRVFKKHLRRIIRAESTPILKTAKTRAKAVTTGTKGSSSTGLLWKSLGTRTALIGTAKIKTEQGFRNVGGGSGMTSAIGPRRGQGRLVLVSAVKKRAGKRGVRRARRGKRAQLLSGRLSKVALRATTKAERKEFGMVFRNPSRYAHLVEGGRKQGKTGVVAARPFMKPAFDAHRNRAVVQVMRRLRSVVLIEARKRA